MFLQLTLMIRDTKRSEVMLLVLLPPIKDEITKI